MIEDWNKKYLVQLDGHEMNIIRGGLGHYYEYLQKVKKKDNIETRRKKEETQRKIENLVRFFNENLFG